MLQNSVQAIEKAASNKYVAILMDINLGHGTDGLNTTKIIRQIDFYKNTPIIAITAFAMSGDKEEFLNQAVLITFLNPLKKMI